MRVAIGSKNPTKADAVRSAFGSVWPDEQWQFSLHSVPSGVPDQPRSDTEALCGARNRARNALNAGDADFGIGLEGGLHQVADRWYDSGWAVIVDREGREGSGTTIRMPVPPPILTLMDAGLELGAACDEIFAERNLKQRGGFFGVMTDGVLDRANTYRDAVVAGLAVFIRKELWD
ncbi:non-canonical purine NTP phosphatase [Paractinoplanes deccanensis]|uniref:Probable inosine/xanthosine triphosphatase n=1 Tax=Paractinoplanes deccanensis TaxID=113561 RepID=A0ABQ3XXI8_9ACTN|nr:inosine/xanthosine triphosphatase [Actinoplanes deccanensis]GID72434.1 non-canonical purine NTP phosphatase [Actinoplanes deccanensis]